jgi:mRNA interferase MazF
VIWLTFTPPAGHEQAGRRPAVVVSPRAYNERVKLALVCPVTSQAKGYPFEVALPAGLQLAGVILADQVKNLDWRVRKAEFVGRLPSTTLSEVTQKLWTLIGGG